MKRRTSLIRRVRPFLIASFTLVSILLSLPARSDDSISLDDPAPAADTAPSGGGEVALDLAADAGNDVFNPYVFSRNSSWIFLPVFGLLLVALHLLPVPKRKITRKIDHANRFFRGISGEATATNIMKTKKVAAEEEGGR